MVVNDNAGVWINAVTWHFSRASSLLPKQGALEDISLSVPTGSRTVIVGPSDSGKSTLLRMIAGFEFPDAALFLGEAVVMPARVEAGWAHCDLGRIPVNNHRNNHCAQIMLRPEQLQLAGEPDGCRAVVTERDLSGNTCTLTVELQPLASGGPPGRALIVRSSGLYAPTGSTVQVSSIGHAHVLSEP